MANSTESLAYLKEIGFSEEAALSLETQRQHAQLATYVEPVKMIFDSGLGVAVAIGFPRIADIVESSFPLNTGAKVAALILRLTSDVVPFLIAGDLLMGGLSVLSGLKERSTINNIINVKRSSSRTA